MANPRKKIPTGPTKDDLLSRLGSAFNRQKKAKSPTPETKTSSSSDPPQQDSSGSQDEQDSLASSADQVTPVDTPEIEPEIQQELDDDPEDQDAQRQVESTVETEEPALALDPLDSQTPALAQTPLDEESMEDPDALSPEDVAFWLESAGSAEAAELMEAMEQIESEEGLEDPLSVNTLSGVTLVETMLDDLLSALQIDEEDDLPVAVTPDPSPLPPQDPHSDTPEDLAPIELPDSQPTSDSSLPKQIEAAGSQHGTPALEATPPAETSTFDAESQILTTQPIRLELSLEASHCLRQIQANYGVPPEILVDVIIQNWQDLPDWAQQKHLGLTHQIQVGKLLEGQQRTIRSIERLLAGDPGN